MLPQQLDLALLGAALVVSFTSRIFVVLSVLARVLTTG
jgi:hypothetical protein